MGAFELDHPSSLIPEPGDVPDLTIRFDTGTGHVLDWGTEPTSIEYHVYEGVLSSQGSTPGLGCLATVAGPPFTLPGADPIPGDAFVYLVSGDDAAREGTLGVGTCAERSNLTGSCP